MTAPRTGWVERTLLGPRCEPKDTAENARFQAAFAAESYAGLRLAITVRLVATVVILMLITLQIGTPMVFFYYPFLAAFALLGLLQLHMRRPGCDADWKKLLFPFLDMALLALALVTPNPFDRFGLPPPMRLQFDGVMYFPLFLSLYMLGQSTRVVLWAGVAAVLSWAGGAFYIAAQPGVQAVMSTAEIINNAPADQRLSLLLNPWTVQLDALIRQVVLILLIAGILGVSVARYRRLVVAQAESERARSNLARHFSPNLVDELAAMDEPLAGVETREVAVLFADIVGFTAMTQGLRPELVIALLREVHARLSAAVFAEGGTLDKYLGDGLMATFGTPRPQGDEATRALGAARAMLAAIDDLNRQRRLLREPPVALSIGLHYGPVTLGNIGDASRLEYAAVGETVNVASRLEELTRPLQARMALSGDFITRLEREGTRPPAELMPLPPQPIRGLDKRLPVWTLPQAGGASAAPTLH